MDDKTKITFQKAAWSDATDAHLSRIDGLEAIDVDFYRLAVTGGQKGLMGVYVNKTMIGSIIWSLSKEPKGLVFVIDEMAAKCSQGLNLIRATGLMAEQFAPRVGADFLRFMTRRAGLMRKMQASFETTYIMEKAL